MDKAILAAWADPDRKRPSLPFRVRGEAQRADSGGAVLGEGTASLKSAYDQQGRPATASVAYNAAFTEQPSCVFVSLSLCLSV